MVILKSHFHCLEIFLIVPIVKQHVTNADKLVMKLTTPLN